MDEKRAADLLRLRAELAKMPQENENVEKCCRLGVQDQVEGHRLLLRTILYNQGQLAEALTALLDEITLPIQPPKPKRLSRRARRISEVLILGRRCVCGGKIVDRVCVDCGVVE